MEKSKINLMQLLYSQVVSFIIIFVVMLSLCHFESLLIIKKILNTTCIMLFPTIVLIYILNKKYSKFVLLFIVFFTTLIISSYLGAYSSISLAFNTYYKILIVIMYIDIISYKNINKIIQ